MVNKLTEVVALCLGLIIGSISTFVNEYFDSPEKMVNSYISKMTISGSKLDFSPANRAEAGGGYVYAAKERNGEEYDLVFVYRVHASWSVINMGIITPSSLFTGTPSDSSGNQVNWSYCATWINASSQIKAVVANTRLVGGESKSIPFGLIQIGNLPIWIYKYPQRVFETVSAEGYDSMGNLIWNGKISS